MPKHETLAAALAAFQAVVPKMSKDERAKVKGETNDGRSYDRSYDYAGLDQFVEIVEPVLGEHGLSVTSAPEWAANGKFVLVVTLLHESGQERTGSWPLPDPYARGVGPQDIGSAMTYGRRYIGWGLTGTFPGGIDDDGKQAQQQARERWEDAKPVQQPQAPAAPTKTSWTDAEVLEQQDKMPGLTPENAAKLYDWMAHWNLHERKVGTSGRTATLMFALSLADQALLPDSTPEDIDRAKEIASARGLLNVKVSATETLEEALFTGRELAAHAADETAKNDTPDQQGGDSADPDAE